MALSFESSLPVSYTHLDVYKRQIVYNEWKKPEDVKKVIVKLYKKDNLALNLRNVLKRHLGREI